MKYIYNIVLFSLILIGFNSCEENENFEILPVQEGITINSPIDGSSIALNGTNTTNPGLTVSWTSPTLEGTGVDYIIEVALIGTDFATPVVLGTTQETAIHLTVDQLNKFALETLKIEAEKEVGIDIRVISGEVISKKISVLLTPFKVEYTEFYLVGSLTNWKPEEALKMTRIDFNQFEITVDLADTDEFKFLPTNTGWTNDFGEDPNNPGKLIKEGEVNLKGFVGKYKITINLDALTYTMKKIVAPENLYVVGSINGWNPENSYLMNKVGDGVFALVLNLPANAEFKFLPTNTGWDGDWGVDPNNAGKIIQDGESNVSGFTGKYLVIVDFNTLTYKLTSVESLFVVGSIVGWDNGAALPMSEASLGIFSVVLDLPDGAEFKFLPNKGSWDGDWGASKTTSGKIVQDDEDNLKGYAAGKYVVAVNFNTLTYTVSKITGVPANLYLVGSFNGWNNSVSSPQFTQVSTGVFEITQAFVAMDEFKFVPVAGSWGDDFGESKVSAKVLEQNDEKNIGVMFPGTYKITVDFNKGTISTVIQ